MKKNLITIALVIAVMMSVIPMANVEAAKVELSDIKGHWAESYVSNFVEQGFIAGYDDGTFKPNDLISKAEFNALLVRVMGYSINTTMPKYGFIDLRKGEHWGKDFILTNINQGNIIHDEDSNPVCYYLDQKISRLQIATMIARALKLTTEERAPLFFDCSESFSISAFKAGIINGYIEDSKRVFKPNEPATRAETVVMLTNLCDYKNDKEAFAKKTEESRKLKPAELCKTLVAKDELTLYWDEDSSSSDLGDYLTEEKRAQLTHYSELNDSNYLYNFSASKNSKGAYSLVEASYGENLKGKLTWAIRAAYYETILSPSIHISFLSKVGELQLETTKRLLKILLEEDSDDAYAWMKGNLNSSSGIFKINDNLKVQVCKDKSCDMSVFYFDKVVQ